MRPGNQALGPISELMADPDITEIMINGPEQVYVERAGLMTLSDVRFDNEDDLRRLVEVLLGPTGRAVSSATPYADFRLDDGSRGNVVIPPIAMNGPVVTIRKFTKTLTDVADLIAKGTLNRQMALLLAAAVAGRANIIFSGAAGTGKTTTLAILSRYIPETERIITIEDTAELNLQQQHVVRMECRRPNLEGRGEVTLSELVRNCLRMRPTRIIVGEIRGAEAVDMLQAISSGHEGCLAVLHASSPLDAVSRLEMMSLARGLMLPLWAVHKQIASAIDLVVQHNLLIDGTRKITRITELTGVDDDRVVLNDLYAYERQGADQRGREVGNWTCSGKRPRFASKCEKLGVALPAEAYAPSAE
jgi:pilus assembly protein CpaF